MTDNPSTDLVRGADTCEAIFDAANGRSVSYAELRQQVRNFALILRDINKTRDLAFLYASNSIDSIVLYLAAAEAGIPLVLLEPREANLLNLVAVYSPTLLLLPSSIPVPHAYERTNPHLDGLSYVSYCRNDKNPGDTNCHPLLAILLQTSGTTGNPKLVRLTARNVFANASSISRYLDLGPGERSIQSLPMHYSYGLSLINSHLAVGGTIVLSPHSFMMGEFWRDFDAAHCTSFAGVPFIYETLHRIGFDPSKHPTLRTMTHRPPMRTRAHATEDARAGCSAALTRASRPRRATLRSPRCPPTSAGRTATTGSR